MRWINRIIVALIIFGIGVIVGWHPTFAGVKAFLLNGASFAVVLGVVIQVGGFLRDWFKDRKEERAKEQERLERERNKKQIYDWLYHKTEEYKEKKVIGVGTRFNTLNDPRFRSTEEIASNIHILSEKVKDLCVINDKLRKMTYDDLIRDGTSLLDEKPLEKWAVKEFVDNYGL